LPAVYRGRPGGDIADLGVGGPPGRRDRPRRGRRPGAFGARRVSGRARRPNRPRLSGHCLAGGYRSRRRPAPGHRWADRPGTPPAVADGGHSAAIAPSTPAAGSIAPLPGAGNGPVFGRAQGTGDPVVDPLADGAYVDRFFATLGEATDAPGLRPRIA